MFKPTHAQITHAETIGQDFAKEQYSKYLAGAEQHGGDIHDLTALQLVEMALEEAIDQYVYIHTLREKLIGLSNETN